MGRDTITLEQAVSTISQEYLQLFCSDYFIIGMPSTRIAWSEMRFCFPGIKHLLLAPSEFIENPAQGSKAPLTLSWERIPRLDSGVRVMMDLFGLIKNPNPKVKVGTRPRAAHEVPLLQATAGRVVNMEETPTISTSTGTPSAMEKSPLDFADEDVQTEVVGEHQTDNPVFTTVPQQEQPAAESAATEVPPETNLEQEVLTMGPPVNKRRRKRDRGETVSSAPSKAPRTERDTAADTQSVSEPEPLSFVVPRPTPEPDVAQSSKAAAVEDEDTEKSSSFISMGGPPDDIYQPNWGITNSCRLDNPLVCQELVDHIIPPGCFSEMRHLPSEDFLSQYNINMARQVALGSQLRLRFEQESKLLKKSVAKIGRREQKIQVQDDKIRNLESLIEAESDMKRAAEAKNETLTKELEDLRAHFSKLQVDSEQLTQQVATLQAQVTGEEKIKAAFEEFKQLEDKRVEQRCAEMDARLDALSIDFDEELYPHMLTAIAGRRWMIGHSPSLEGHDPEANEKFTAALQALKDLKYPLIDDLEQLKDAPIECIMASLHLESDTGEDAPPKVRDPRNPWAVREEILLEDAIAANISRAEKKKKSRVVCRTHGIGSAHHARSDGMPVSVPVVPQGLQIVITDASTQTGVDKDNSPRRLTRASSVPLF
ncbi:hypothetical protein Tco_1096508 [Tanacetum coccineum]